MIWPLIYKLGAISLWVAGLGGLIYLLGRRDLRAIPRYRRALALSLAGCFVILAILGMAFP